MGRHLKLIKSSSCFVCFQEAESDNTVNNTSPLDPIHPPAPVVKAKASSVLKNSLIISKTAEFFKQKKNKAMHTFAASSALDAGWILWENFCLCSRADPREHAEFWEESRPHWHSLHTTQGPGCWRNTLPLHVSVDAGQFPSYVWNKTRILFCFLELILLFSIVL